MRGGLDCSDVRAGKVFERLGTGGSSHGPAPLSERRISNRLRLAPQPWESAYSHVFWLQYAPLQYRGFALSSLFYKPPDLIQYGNHGVTGMCSIEL